MSQQEADGWGRFLLLVLLIVLITLFAAFVYHVTSAAFHQVQDALVSALGSASSAH